MMEKLDGHTLALGIMLGVVAGFTIAAALGGWASRRRGPRAILVRYLPRDPEMDALVKVLNDDLYDRQPDADPEIRAKYRRRMQ